MSQRARARLEPLLGTRLSTIAGEARGWRTQARLAASPAGEKSWQRGVRLGLYRGGTHEVERIPECQVHAAAVNKAAATVEAACAATGVRGADGGEGDLRYAQFSVERRSGLVALTLVWNAETGKASAPELPRLVGALWPKRGEQHELWHSIWVNYRGSGPGNAIFNYEPRRWDRLRGPEFVREPLFLDTKMAKGGVDADLELRFTPLVFRQANLQAFAALVADLARFVPDRAVLCELYAGVGAIGLALRPKLAELRCSDDNPNAGQCFAAAALDQEARLGRRLPPASFAPLAAAEALDFHGPGADLLIVDPPRKGLDPAVLAVLLDPVHPCAVAINRLIYVSCGFEAFERDLADLTRRNDWHLVHAQAHLLFPGSDHVETLAVFDRGPPPSTAPASRRATRSQSRPGRTPPSAGDCVAAAAAVVVVTEEELRDAEGRRRLAR